MNPQLMMLKAQLTQQQLLVFESEMHRYRKEPILAFLLAFFLGIFGAHHFYLGRNRPGIIMLCLSLSVIGLLVSFPWKIVNWFTVWSETTDVNDELEYAMLCSMLYPGSYPEPPTRPTIGGLPMRVRS